MEIRLHARNTNVDPAFRAAVEDKLGHAARVFEAVRVLDVELTEETNPRLSDERYRLELTGSVNGQVVRIASASATPEAALDDAVERLGRRLRRLKERMIDTHRRAVVDHESLNRSIGVAEETDVVRTKQFVMKPMSVQEAGLQMDLLGHDFFFFHNRATDKQSVLYRRDDGRFGLIEPA